MENDQQQLEGQDPNPKDLSKKPITNQEAAEFENPSTDPGFEPSFLEKDEETAGEEEKENDTNTLKDDDDLINDVI
jgi:hypothetical protein